MLAQERFEKILEILRTETVGDRDRTYQEAEYIRIDDSKGSDGAE